MPANVIGMTTAASEFATAMAHHGAIRLARAVNGADLAQLMTWYHDITGWDVTYGVPAATITTQVQTQLATVLGP